MRASFNLLFIAILFALFTTNTAFHVGIHKILTNKHESSSTTLKMGLFDSLFGPKKTASASHILVKVSLFAFKSTQ